MTDKQFEFIMQSLRHRLLVSLHDKAFVCEVNPEHVDPEWRYRNVVDTIDIDEAIRITFNEILEDEI